MAIDKENIDKIHSIFLHLQLVNRNSIQKYDPMNPHRERVIIGEALYPNYTADEVYCHTPKLNAWHQRIWAKRIKEIPFRAFLFYFDKEGVYRIGFSSLPENNKPR